MLQNLAYAYDPVGNITEINDSAQQTVFFDNAVISPSTRYVYDALYRLIEATGREHAGGMADVQRDQNDVPLLNLPHANDAAALRNYAESYVYDKVGNILSMRHDAGAVDWTRRYEIAATSNRLLSTSGPDDGPTVTSYSATYAYDEHGSMTSMPHLPSMGWDHNDQMRQLGLRGGGTAYYTYDAAGQRVRKVWEHSGLVEERIYLGGWELYRKRDSLRNLLVERETLHGMDGARRVVLVETKTVDVDAGGAFAVVSRFRFQLDNHLGSASLEVDETGLVIGYEEYHPYGTASYRSGTSSAEVSRKRDRYTGKERDEETGLYYHGARYYAPWLARWTTTDPAGLQAGLNLFSYVRNRPVNYIDPSGLDGEQAGWFSRHLGPASPLGQWVAHADYVGSSVIQDDRKLAAAQHAAVGVAVVAATIASAGAASEAAAGYLAANGVTGIGAAALNGAASGVVGGVTGRFLSTASATGELKTSVKAAIAPNAVAKDAVTGAGRGAAKFVAAMAGTALRAALSPRAGGTGDAGGSGTPAPSTRRHVVQKEITGCGPACGEMASEHQANENPGGATTTNQMILMQQAEYNAENGGMPVDGLSNALQRTAPVVGRQWQADCYLDVRDPTVARVRAGIERAVQEGGGVAIIQVIAQGEKGPYSHFVMVDAVTETTVHIHDPEQAGPVDVTINSQGFGGLDWAGDAVAAKVRAR